MHPLVLLALGIITDMIASQLIQETLWYGLVILGVLAFLVLVLGFQWNAEQQRREQERKDSS